MDLAIDGNDELVHEECAGRVVGYSLGFLDGPSDAVLLRRQDKLRPKVLYDDLPLVAGVFIDDDDDAVAAGGSGRREPDAKVSTAGGDDRAPWPQLAAL